MSRRFNSIFALMSLVRQIVDWLVALTGLPAIF